MLNDDALLNIFYLYELAISESYSEVFNFPHWADASWWYKPAQVCQRWRYLIFASPARLGLHLVCTYGTPVANMLTHSPHLPLIINFLPADQVRKPSIDDEENILLALQYRDRVRRIGLQMPTPDLLKFIKAIDGQFPALERLFIWPQTQDDVSLAVTLPTTFQAPHLGMLSLSHAALPVGSSLLTTTIGLTSLELSTIPSSAYFHPSYLIVRISSMPQLERFTIGFKSSIPTRHVERQPLHTLIEPHVTLPQLRVLSFRGVSAYLEQLLARINTPLLEAIQIRLSNQLNFMVPHLSQFMSRAEDLTGTFSITRLFFYREAVFLAMDSLEGGRFTPFHVTVGCRHIDWQVSAAAQIFNTLVHVVSVVKRLVIDYEEHDLSSEQHNGINRIQWRNLLRPFNSVEALHVPENLIGHLSRSLQLEDGEPPMELLPELKELLYKKEGDPSDTFTPFINERQIAGRPVTLIHVPSPPATPSRAA